MAKAPSVVLDYVLGDRLGLGGNGAVYQGIHTITGGFAAIKQIKISNLPKDKVASIMTEIDLLKKLKHDNIVKYIGYSKTKDYLSIVLEFVESGSLSGILQKFGKFPESLVRVYISQVLNGLVYLHEQGVIHRDIKGANILITKKGHVKLADFGVAVEKVHATSEADTVAGTPYWMAPEIIELAGATTKSDIWSVGCTVIELLTGEPPYFDLAPMPALFRIVQDDHPPLPPDISSALKDFLLLTFQKDPLLRVEARALLKHPWIRSNAKNKNSEAVTKNFEDVERNLKEYNNELNKRDKVSSIKASLEQLKQMWGASKSPNNNSSSSNNSSAQKSNQPSSSQKGGKAVAAPPTSSPSSSGSKGAHNRDVKSSSSRDKNDHKSKQQKGKLNEESWDDIEWSPSPQPPRHGGASNNNNKLKTSGNKKSMKKSDHHSPSSSSSSSSSSSKSTTSNASGSKKAVVDDWDREFESPPVRRAVETTKKKPSSRPTLERKKKDSPKLKPKSPAPPSSSSKNNVDSWDDLDFETPSKPALSKPVVAKPKSASPSSKDDESWDNLDFETPKSMPKPKLPSSSKDEDNWDDIDFESPSVTKLKPQIAISKPKPKPVIKDEDNWDDIDFDKPIVSKQPIKTPQKKISSPTAASSSSDDWDDFEDIPKLKPTSIPAKTLTPPSRGGSGSGSTAAIIGTGSLKPQSRSIELAGSSKPSSNNEDDDFDSDFGEVNFAVKLKEKIAMQKQAEVAIEDDDFEFDEIFDEDDFESHRDTFLAISNEILSLLTLLEPTQPDDIIQTTANELITIYRCNNIEKSRLIRHHGIIPILEILEVTSVTNLPSILSLVSQIVEDNLEIQENFCLVGGIPTILEFANSKYSKEIRLMAAKFVKQMCSSSTLTRQMFVACRGLPVLVRFLETTNYREDKEFVCMAVDGIQAVFELQSATPKNDFCRLFAKCNALKYLARDLVFLIQDQNTATYIAKAVDIFLQFSSGDAVVKTRMADPASDGCLYYIFQAMDMLKSFAPQLLIILLKSIKQLSMHSNTLSPLQEVGAIPKLISYFNTSTGKFATEINNQIVSTIYNLTRIHRQRQEEAATSGIIPHLQTFIGVNSPLKQFALGMIIDFGHLPKARIELNKYGGIAYFLNLLSCEEYWRGNLFDVIALWITDDSSVEKEIIDHIESMQKAFISTSNLMIANLVEPLLKICQQSTLIRSTLASSKEFVIKLVERLTFNHSAVIMLNLLKILGLLFETHPDLVLDSYVVEIIRHLTNDAQSILVQDLAGKLLLSFNLISKKATA